MKAIVQRKYGSPDVLRLEDVVVPEPRDDEVLVRVRASSLNAADDDLLRGTAMIRLGAPFRPKYRIPGSDVAGQVEAVGAGVVEFRLGDEVLGDLSVTGYGAFADYVSVPQGALAQKPAALTFEQAATVPQAGLIALQGLRDIKPVEAGQHVLINGAGGGMGTYAVQIAKSFGAEVTGVDSALKLDMLRQLGADHVIDYAAEDFTTAESHYDLVLDMVGTHSIGEYRRTLKPQGALGMVGGPISRFMQVQLQSAKAGSGDGQKLAIVMWRPNRAEDMAFLMELLEAGTVTPVIERSYPLSEVPEAFRHLEAGGVLGKLAITI
jgi:NADPH:quinone reductase-like Zn-dependent oxidoreductase